MKNAVELYPDAAGEWRWSLLAAENGQRIADGSEGYVNKDDALNGFLRTGMSAASNFEVWHYKAHEGVGSRDYAPIKVEQWGSALSYARQSNSDLVKFAGLLDFFGVSYEKTKEDDDSITICIYKPKDRNHYLIFNFKTNGSFKTLA